MTGGMPKLLCKDCTYTVLQFFKFKQQIEYSNNILSEITKTKGLKNNSAEILGNDHIEEVVVSFGNSEVTQEEQKVEKETHMNEDLKTNKCLTSISCKFCFLKFDSLDLYKLHRKKEAEQRRKQGQCPVCNKLIVKYKLKDHINSHTKECPYECDLCGENFRFRSSLSRHKFRHNDKKPHECHICGKGFIQAPTLRDHLRTHTGNKSFICNICGKSFITKHALGNHINMHKVKYICNELDADNRCQKCNTKFATKIQLKSHMVVHNVKNFLCNICGKFYCQKSLLESHMKSHSAIKPFKCTYCKKAFSHKNTLQKHILIHGQKSIICIVCEKAFLLKSQLNSHMRKHSGERPYSCSYCTKAFSHSGSLKIHIRTHTGEKPFICEFCSKGFPDSSGLKKHLKKHYVAKFQPLDNENKMEFPLDI